MNNYIKIIKWSVIIGVSLAMIIQLLIPSLVIGGIIPFEPSHKQMAKICGKNYDDMIYITEKLESMDYSYIAIREIDGSDIMGVKNPDGTYDDVTIEDTSLTESLERLFDNGFEAVFKYDTHIEFLIWSSLDNSKGIAYSYDEDKPDVDWVIDMHPIQGTEFYSYESCYELYDEDQDEVIEKPGTQVSVDSIDGITQEQAIELCASIFGKKDQATGNTFSFLPSGAAELDGKQYYVITLSWLVDNSHYSRLGELMVAADGSVVCDGYIDGSGEYIFCDIIWEKQ